MASLSLTQSLLASDLEGYTRATTSPFLTSASQGQTPKETLGRWLANDRLYIHAYTRAIGRILTFLPIKDEAPTTGTPPSDPETRLLDWLVDALVNIRREENFFLATAARFGIAVNLPVQGSRKKVPDEAKLEGLLRWEALFGSVQAPTRRDGNGDAVTSEEEEVLLPWLEAAVIYWGTEICYLDAWKGVKQNLKDQSSTLDSDGGALRLEFIPNWTNDAFATFVHRLGDILDEAVEEQARVHGEAVREQLLQRALVKWRDVLLAEEHFWPA